MKQRTLQSLAVLLLLCITFCVHAANGKSSFRAVNIEPVSKGGLKVGAEQMDRLLPMLRNKRVALVVNHTSIVDKKGTHLLDSLIACKITVKKIFAPEHGFRGNADAGEQVKDGKDSKTGIPIISLYGKNKKPSKEQMADVDVVVFDIQDVGARFYTYISTMHYVMEACAENGKKLIITDRPNPCDQIDGPIMKSALRSFVGMHLIPLLHGCTVGELAQMINGEGWLEGKKKCPLTIIKIKNWKHGQPYSLPVKPSPNLVNNHAISFYASLCPFEATEISVGRGTHIPFEVLGAPNKKYGEFTFTPTSMTGFDKNPLHKNELCYGVDLRKAPSPKGFTLKYIIQFYKKSGQGADFFTRPRWFDQLMGDPSVRKEIIEGKSEAEIKAGWKQGLAKYKKMRSKYLLYAE
jgi:uncharacterized protein YbbC (DUF1343 family)